MEYTIEELSPIERRVQVNVTAEEVNASLLATTAIYRHNADMKGFRKGKVPSAVIEGKFKKQILAEATTDLINYHINDIMNELALMPLSGIQVDSKELEKNAPFAYSFTFEVAPKIDLPTIRGLPVEVEDVVVEEDEIDKVVDRVRGNMAELEDVAEEREPRDGEIVILDFAALGLEKEFEGLRASNFQLTLGEGQALESFEALVKSTKKGAEGRGMVSFPEDFLNDQLSGKTVEMSVFVKQLKTKNLPAADDSLAQRAGGFESYQAFRDMIRKSITESKKSLNKSVAQKKLLDGLLQGLEFPLPPSLVERNLEQMVKEVEARLDRRGKGLASLGKSVDELKVEYRPQAEEMARTQLFLLAVASAENLTVSQPEIDAEIKKTADKIGSSFDEVKQAYDHSGTTILLKDRILADKAMELIYQEAQVTTVAPKPAEAGDAA